MFIYRFAKRFNDEARWIYNCTCDRPQAELTDSLPNQMNISYDDFQRQRTSCLHIEAAQAVITHVDAINDIYPEREFQGDIIKTTKLVIILLVFIDHTYSGIEIDGDWNVRMNDLITELKRTFF